MQYTVAESDFIATELSTNHEVCYKEKSEKPKIFYDTGFQNKMETLNTRIFLSELVQLVKSQAYIAGKYTFVYLWLVVIF